MSDPGAASGGSSALPQAPTDPVEGSAEERKMEEIEMMEAGGTTGEDWITRTLESSPESPAAGSLDEVQKSSLQRVKGYGEANWLSRVTIWFMTSLVHRGSTNARLDMEDLPDLTPADLSKENGAKFLQLWEEELQHPEPSVWRAIRRLGGWSLIFAMLLAILTEVVVFAGPMLVKFIVNWVEDPDAPMSEGWILASMLLIAPLLESILRNNHWILIWRVSIRVRSALVSTIFQKELGGVTLQARDGQAQDGAKGKEEEGKEEVGTSGGPKPSPKEGPTSPSDSSQKKKRKKKQDHSNVVNLISTDEQKFREFWPICHFLLTSPISITVCMILLWFQVGASTLAGIGVIVFALPFNGYLAGGIGRQRQKEAVFCDQRLHLARQVLGDIRTIKMYGWTTSFLDRIFRIRQDELRERRRGLIYEAFMHFAVVSIPILISIVTFTVFAATGGDLTAERVFVSISLFNVARFQLNTLPRVVSGSMELRVSLQRIKQQFMSQQFQAPVRSPDPEGKNDILLSFRDTSVSWDGETPCLENLNLEIRKGKLICVIGGVASGKTSLLASILGELRVTAGELFLNERLGDIAYASQVTWLQNATVRENILFGRRYYPDLYAEVIQASALLPDLREWSDGDNKQVSSGASSLSGGQKARVALARALYAECEHLYLLDDPLSAVDAQVSEHLFYEYILGSLCGKGRTVLLTLNQLQYLPFADHIVMLQDNTIHCQGTFQELLDTNEAFRGLMQRHGFQKEEVLEPAAEREKRRTEYLREEPPPSLETVKRAIIEESGAETHGPSEEHRSIGSISWKVYRTYILAVGGALVAGYVFLSFTLHNVGRVGADWWLAMWAAEELEGSTATLIAVFAGMGLAVVANSLLRSFIFAKAITLSAGTLHKRFASSVLRAQARFFDTTPVGVALNRFSADFDRVDHLLGRLIEGWGGSIFFVFGCLAAICIIFGYIIVFPLLFVMLVYWRVQRYFVVASRELQRLDNVSRSPVFNQLQEAVDGRSILRAFGQTERFMVENFEFLDRNHTALFHFQSSLAWLDNFVSIVSALIMFFCGVFIVERGKDLDASLVGLALSYCFVLPKFLTLTVRLWSTLESEFTAVERISEFTEVPQEAPHHLQVDETLQEVWPKVGAVSFRGVTMRYAPELPPVIQGVTLNVRPGEKVAVVGRTGSGKSTLVAACLFRLVEMEAGSIWIDGVDISKIGLELLRSKLAIIPQDPVIFPGTLRYNLDPFDEFSDSDIWEALEMVGLAPKIIELTRNDPETAHCADRFLEAPHDGSSAVVDGKDEHKTDPSPAVGPVFDDWSLPPLAVPVSEDEETDLEVVMERSLASRRPDVVLGEEERLECLQFEIKADGSSWSAGERQLLCIARAALRCITGRSKVLVLDEATSSTDSDTDRFIQNMLREHFQDITILTVAHRLLSIIDYDRVICLERGRLAQFDTPYNLLKLGPGTLFHDLVGQTGEQNAAFLTSLAQKKHEERQRRLPPTPAAATLSS